MKIPWTFRYKVGILREQFSANKFGLVLTNSNQSQICPNE